MTNGTIKKMERKASDNVYLHRDFHGIFDLGLDYLQRNFGREAVVEYLRRFTLHFYAPLVEEMRSEPFEAIRRRFETIYGDEQDPGVLSFERSGDELVVRIERCPAIEHLRRSGIEPSTCFRLTSDVVWQTLCEKSDISYELQSYDAQTGRAVHVFRRPESRNGKEQR